MRQLRNISILQTIGIILVVLGHSFYRIPPDNIIIRWIYAFHMPLFFFISGYLLRYTHADIDTMPLKCYFERKARRLLMPYFVISSILFLPKAFMGKYAVRPIELNWHSYFDMLLIPYHNVLGAYWFMPTLFLIFLFFILMARILGDRMVRSLPVLLFFMALTTFMNFRKDSLLNIMGVAYYMVFFISGYDYRNSKLEKTVAHANEIVMCVITFIFSLALLIMPSFSMSDLLSAFNGILFIIVIAKIYEKNNCHFLDHLFGATYYIYLFSGIFQIFSLQILLHFVPLPPYIYIPLGFVTGMYGPWLMYKTKIISKGLKLFETKNISI